MKKNQSKEIKKELQQVVAVMVEEFDSFTH